MEMSVLVTLLVFAFGAVFLYFVGAVIIQSLRLSILQVKSDVKIKMDQHNNELEHQRFYLESKRLQLQGKTQPEEKKKTPNGVTTIELGVDGNTSGLKDMLESIDGIKKFVILKKSVLLDVEEDKTPSQLIEEIEKKTRITVTQVNFAKNPEKTVVREREI